MQKTRQKQSGNSGYVTALILLGALMASSVPCAAGKISRGNGAPSGASGSRAFDVSEPLADALADPALQRGILALARRAFDSYAKDRTVIDAPTNLPPVLTRARCGVFVSTMRPGGAPRTCMGTLYPAQADLADEIIENAVASAGRDLRFKPVQTGELPQLDLIISVIVGPPRPISAEAAANLDPARDGLAVQRGERFGVVLSGETPSIANMLAWGKIRAGAKPDQTNNLLYYAVDDVRFMESQFKQ